MYQRITNLSNPKTGGPPCAAHYRANLVPVPQPFEIAPQYQGDVPLERARAGFCALHDLWAAIYRAGVEAPEDLIPASPGRRPRGLKDEEFAAYPRLLFALGIFGALAGDPPMLQVDSGALAGFCSQARIKEPEAFFQSLRKFGLEYLPSQPLVFRFPDRPDLAPALARFARLCRPLTKKDVNPPVEFLRADLRILRRIQKKARAVPVEIEEAAQTLADEKEAAFLRELDAWARSEGYLLGLKCAGVGRSEFIGKYRRLKPGRILFGFMTESGQLHMHFNFNQTVRILPYIAQTPRSFRELYYEKCTCAECGSCQDGPLQVVLDDQPRRLCHFSYMNVPELQAEHYETLHWVIQAQAEILKAG